METNKQQWSLIVILVMTSTIGLSTTDSPSWPLFNIIRAEAAAHPIVHTSGAMLAVLIALLIWLGVYHAPLLDMIQNNAVPFRWN